MIVHLKNYGAYALAVISWVAIALLLSIHWYMVIGIIVGVIVAAAMSHTNADPVIATVVFTFFWPGVLLVALIALPIMWWHLRADDY